MKLDNPRNLHSALIMNLSRMGSALLLAALIEGCTKSPHQVIHDSYQEDARQCFVRNQVKGASPVNSNVATILPESADPSVGLDINNYLACMKTFGYGQDKQTDPLLKALNRCNRMATRFRAQTARGVKIGASFDQQVFKSCLTQRGFDAEALVIPQDPATQSSGK